MHIDRSKLDTLRKDLAKKRLLTQNNIDTSDELNKIISVINAHFKESTIEKSTNWMLYHDLWLQNESSTLQNQIYRNYTRGSIIMSLDWGTSNIGTEIRYPHPGVVLFDQGEDWIIAAPITACKLDRVTSSPIPHPQFEVLAMKQNNKPTDSNEYWFRKHSVIQVDQIQRISKYRALNKNSYKIRKNLLNQIDNMILSLYIPEKHKLMETLKEELILKKEDLFSANEEIANLRGQIAELNLKLNASIG